MRGLKKILAKSNVKGNSKLKQKQILNTLLLLSTHCCTNMALEEERGKQDTNNI